MKKKRILIVDDDRELTELVRHRLNHEGYETMSAFCGEEGLTKAKGSQPDLIILDILMDDMDGYEVTRRLKSDIETCAIPILILSVRQGLDDRLTALFLGAMEFLPKPYDPYRLVSAVRHILREEKLSKKEET